MPLPADTAPTFYCKESGRIQTYANCKSMEDYDPINTPILWHKGTGEEYLRENPNLILLPFHEALKLSQEADKKRYKVGTATRITEERFDEALNCLPPCNWESFPSSESFRCSEDLCGIISAFYARKYQKFYQVNLEKFSTHSDVMEAIDKTFPEDETEEAARQKEIYPESFQAAGNDSELSEELI